MLQTVSFLTTWGYSLPSIVGLSIHLCCSACSWHKRQFQSCDSWVSSKSLNMSRVLFTTAPFTKNSHIMLQIKRVFSRRLNVCIATCYVLLYLAVLLTVSQTVPHCANSYNGKRSCVKFAFNDEDRRENVGVSFSLPQEWLQSRVLDVSARILARKSLSASWNAGGMQQTFTLLVHGPAGCVLKLCAGRF